MQPIQRQHTPIATHLYLPQLLNDDIPAQRRGLKAGKEILDSRGTMFIGIKYGLSAGMIGEMAAAEGKHITFIV